MADAERTKTTTKTGHFARQRALLAGGWAAVLTKKELSLWLAYEQHADRDGVGYPSNATLAELARCSESHVGAYRDALVRHGLLEVVETGGGRGRPWRVRVLMPGTPAPKPPREPARKGRVNREVYDAGKVAVFDPKPRGFDPVKVAVLDQKGRGFEGALKKDELTNELTNEQPLPAAPPRGPGPVATDAAADQPAPAKPAGPTAPVEGKPAGQTPKLRMNPEQSVIWRAFKLWYSREGFPSTHAGVAYGFHPGRDPKAAHAILDNPNVGWDLEAAKAITLAFASDVSDAYLRSRGHKLYDLADRVDAYAVRVRQRQQGITHARNSRPSAVDRGEYETALPVGSRKFGD